VIEVGWRGLVESAGYSVGVRIAFTGRSMVVHANYGNGNSRRVSGRVVAVAMGSISRNEA
jgi:hypothetical protein